MTINITLIIKIFLLTQFFLYKLIVVFLVVLYCFWWWNYLWFVA